MLVVDAATFLAGPGAATVLGDYGATVVKIEPQEGDRYRRLKGQHHVDYNWLLTSRNKKSIAIDLTRAEGREVVHGLVAKADVFLTNFIGEQLERYEYEYERLSRINPKLIYAHVTGYGTEGRDVMKRSFDATAWWARSGLMELVREQGVKPAISAPGMGDHATSMSLFSAIMTGLYRREKTGRGSYVHTSLVANGVWSNGMALQGVIAGVNLSERRQATGMNNPFGWAYQARDGAFILFSIINAEREWPNLVTALGKEEWFDDPRFVDLRSIISNRHELIQMVQAEIEKMDSQEASRLLDEHGITHSIVAQIGEVVDDSQLSVNDIIVETNLEAEGFDRTIMSPIRIGGESKKQPELAPDVGANSREVLQDILSLSSNQIESLISSGVIATEQKVD